jgi:DNA-binding NarL/FixJ family response regulator
MRRPHVLGDFTEHELLMIRLRTHGVKTPEIGRRLGIKRSSAYQLLWTIFHKVGVNDVALLTRWAIENGIDEVLLPETLEEQP